MFGRCPMLKRSRSRRGRDCRPRSGAVERRPRCGTCCGCGSCSCARSRRRDRSDLGVQAARRPHPGRARRRAERARSAGRDLRRRPARRLPAIPDGDRQHDAGRPVVAGVPREGLRALRVPARRGVQHRRTRSPSSASSSMSGSLSRTAPRSADTVGNHLIGVGHVIRTIEPGCRTAASSSWVRAGATRRSRWPRWATTSPPSTSRQLRQADHRAGEPVGRASTPDRATSR